MQFKTAVSYCLSFYVRKKTAEKRFTKIIEMKQRTWYRNVISSMYLHVGIIRSTVQGIERANARHSSFSGRTVISNQSKLCSILIIFIEWSLAEETKMMRTPDFDDNFFLLLVQSVQEQARNTRIHMRI